MNKKIKIYLDPEKVQSFFGTASPFNLKNELRGIEQKDQEYIISTIADQLVLPAKPPARCIITRNKNIYIIKIRCQNPGNNKGKSGGYRVVVLVDENLSIGIILSIINKSNSADLTMKEKNILKKLVQKCF